MIIISYTTPKYEGVYEDYLGKSLEAAGINNRAHMKTPEMGNWAANTRLKPLLILQAFARFKADSVLYLDADSTASPVVKNIDAFVPQNFHTAGHFLDIGKWYGNDSKEKGFLTGTLYFRQRAIPLLLKWLKACKEGTEPDGVYLEQLVKGDLGVFDLPLEWCYMDSQPDGSENKIKIENPIVTHHQLSRKLKGGIAYKDYKLHKPEAVAHA